jgi:uncharacterized protein YjbI with pentapeptide repeats
VITTIDDELIFAVFSDMDLSNADFRNARLRYAKFIRCNVEGADFRGADMLAGYISQTDFKKAITDSTTKMPVPPTYSASYM